MSMPLEARKEALRNQETRRELAEEVVPAAQRSTSRAAGIQYS